MFTWYSFLSNSPQKINYNYVEGTHRKRLTKALQMSTYVVMEKKKKNYSMDSLLLWSYDEVEVIQMSTHKYCIWPNYRTVLLGFYN